MLEGRALRRAAWRELWPAAMLLVGCALALAYGIGREAPIWVGLWLAPVALLCGTACSRGSKRVLSFYLARPIRRERMLDSRLMMATVAVVGAWLILAVAVIAHAPRTTAFSDAVLVLVLLELALLCGALGGTATDREPLAFGIATLVYASIAAVPMMATEALDITLARTLHGFGPGVVVVAIAGALGLVRALRRAWRDGPPAYATGTVRTLAVASAGSWAFSMPFVVAMIWWSASPEHAVPLIVIGTHGDRLILASGSPAGLDGSVGARVDTIHIGLDGPRVAMEVESAEGRVITDAVQIGGRMFVNVSHDEGASCEVVALDNQTAGTQALDVECGTLTPSPSGRRVAVTSDHALTLFDVETNEVLLRDRGFHRHDVLRWRDEVPVPPVNDAACRDAARVEHAPSRARRTSPDGRRIAASIVTISATGRGSVEVLSIDDESVRTLLAEAHHAALLGWLGNEHIAVVTAEPSPMLSVFDVTTGDVVAGPVSAPMLSTAIEGPIVGPWLVTGRHGMVTAVASDGAELWSETLGKFDRQDASRRRWAIVDHDVVGIDASGRVWRRPVPWEAMP